MHIRHMLIGIFSLLACSAAQAAGSEPMVKGFMVTGSVDQVLGSAGESGGVRYWDKYVGGDLNVGMEHVAIDASGTDVIKTTDVSVDGGILVGVPIGRVKPYMRLGFGYSYAKDDVSNTKAQLYGIEPSVGIDFMASKHLLFGVRILSFPVTVGGDVNGTGVSGYDFSFLNEMHVGYVF